MNRAVTPLFISRHVQPPSFSGAACDASEWLDWWRAPASSFRLRQLQVLVSEDQRTARDIVLDESGNGKLYGKVLPIRLSVR